MFKRIDPFVPLILLMILLARLFPELGVARDWINPSQIANWGVCIVFFFYGLKLNGQKIKQGVSNYKLHILIQLTTFILFPLLVLPFMPENPDALWLGVFFVAALPSTVSSSVVMVSIARGNIPGAIFNSSISSLLGVIFTPAIMGLYLRADVGSEPIETVVIKLILQVVVPVGIGMFLNRWWGNWAETHKGKLRWYDQCVILAIVWTAFCEGYNSGVFTSVGVKTMLQLIGGMLALFLVSFGVIYLICRWLKFSREDKITATFCGSKKSLVHGTVMIKILITKPSVVGVMLLPIMVFHVMQLIIISSLASHLNHKLEQREKAAALIAQEDSLESLDLK